ncbi:MAG: MBG domain-containing protein, partial [Myroides sp.]|nr:MBG domain-containing protein [Myroides sp.]
QLTGAKVTYDGNAHKVTVTGEPAGTVVTYTYSKDGQPIVGEPTEAGVYTVTAVITGDNYITETLTETVTIDKAEITTAQLTGSKVTYDGNAHKVTVTGEPAGTVVTYTYSKDGQPIVGEPTEAGIYTVTAVITGDNYITETLTETVTIDKAAITTAQLTGAKVTYDGNAHKVTVTGEPAGTVVAYTYSKDGQPITGEPTEAGVYTVTAVITGDNYITETLTETVTIDKAAITGIAFADKTVTYDGTAQLLEVTGILPTGVTVAYTDNSKTEAGQYNAVAVLTGGNNYVDQTLSAKLTIDKAAITGISFADKTVTYDGTAQLLEVTGTLPTGVTVAYTDNSKTEAGQYNAVAVLTGGNNYVDQTLNAKLTIDKAAITGVSFVDKKVAYNKKEQIIEITGVLPKGATVVYSNAKQIAVGVYKVVANILGGNNYNDLRLEATFEIFEDRAPSKEANINEITINGVVFKNPNQVIEYMLEPGDDNGSTQIKIGSIAEYSTINKPNEFVVDTGKPNVYYVNVVVTSEDGTVSTTYTIKLIKPIDSKFIVMQKFQNTLVVYNNPAINKGYKFINYQWFKNGVLVGTKQSYSVGQNENNKLNPKDEYYVIVKSTEEEEIYSTRINIYEEGTKEVLLYPNPVSIKDMTTNIKIDYSEDQFRSGKVDILMANGKFVYGQELTIGENKIVLPSQISAGIYFAVVEINGRKQTIRFIIK